MEADTQVKFKRLLGRYVEEFKVGGIYGRQGLRGGTTLWAERPVMCCTFLFFFVSMNSM